MVKHRTGGAAQAKVVQGLHHGNVLVAAGVIGGGTNERNQVVTVRDLRALAANQLAQFAVYGVVPCGGGEQGSLAQRAEVRDGGVVANELGDAMAVAAKESDFVADHGVFSACELVAVVDYKDARVAHLSCTSVSRIQSVGSPCCCRIFSSRQALPLAIFRITRLARKPWRRSSILRCERPTRRSGAVPRGARGHGARHAAG